VGESLVVVRHHISILILLGVAYAASSKAIIRSVEKEVGKCFITGCKLTQKLLQSMQVGIVRIALIRRIPCRRGDC